MSETILRIRLDELKTVRLICAECEGVLELPLEKLQQTPDKCPLCSRAWAQSRPNYFSDLQAAAHGILTAGKTLRMEFVIPQPSPDR